MDLKTRNMNNGTMVIEVTGRLDAVTSPLFEKEIVAFLAKEKQGMALDFGHLDYISSSGLRALILGAKKAKANNGALVLFGLKQQVLEVFDISGFSSILTILPGEAEALAYIDHQLER
ncbi:MAG: STAS domain-containing protein [Deltaproteobacteria bacterium]